MLKLKKNVEAYILPVDKVSIILKKEMIDDLRIIADKLDRGMISKTIRRACEQYIKRRLPTLKGGEKIETIAD